MLQALGVDACKGTLDVLRSSIHQIFRMVVKNEMLLTFMPSRHKVTEYWGVINSLVILIWSSMTGRDWCTASRLSFQGSDIWSKDFLAMLTSSVVIGLFLIAFIQMIAFMSLTDGYPRE